MWEDLIDHLLNALKTKDKLHFTIINYTSYYTLYPKFWIFIQVNSKLNGRVQSVKRVIIKGAKRAFEKFKMQNVT